VRYLCLEAIASTGSPKIAVAKNDDRRKSAAPALADVIGPGVESENCGGAVDFEMYELKGV
jgi:hypothetical protein